MRIDLIQLTLNSMRSQVTRKSVLNKKTVKIWNLKIPKKKLTYWFRLIPNDWYFLGIVA